MAYNFHPVNRKQMYLMPPSIQDWLPEDDLAWFVLDATSQMELSKFYAKYRSDGWGHVAFEPSMMVSLLLYAYCVGERSSRKIEWLCRRDIAFRVITANQVPDHSTICRFRKSNEKELAELFTEVLRLCAKAGLVKVGIVALDGTKIKANASLSSNRTYESIRQEVERMLKEADEVDAEEDRLYGPLRSGYELPAELSDRRSRLARLRECKERLERESAEESAKQKEKIEEREKEEERTGKKRRGRKPKEPQEVPKEEAKANVTDPESRIMKTRSGYIQGYNAQAVVTEEQIIVAAEVTQEENDVQQLHPMLKSASENLVVAGVEENIGIVLADAGYCSEANLAEMAPESPDLIIAVKKEWKQRKEEEPAPRGRIPKGLTARERMERKLRTKRGKFLYKKRSPMVEPPFGHIKAARGCDVFMRRGGEACDSEWKLVCATGNLLKLWRKTGSGFQKVCRSVVSGIKSSLRMANIGGGKCTFQPCLG